MAEQLFGLDITIDEKVWWNFSSHPLREASKRDSSIIPPSNLVETEAKNVESNPNATQTIDEVIQSSESFDSKVTKLFKGDFRVDPETKPKYHLLVNFEDKEGVPLILAMPAFTRQDIYDHFNPKPKLIPQEEALQPEILAPQPEVLAPPVIPITQQEPIVDLTPAINQPTQETQAADLNLETRSEVLVPKPEIQPPVETTKIEEPLLEDLSIKTPAVPLIQKEVISEPVQLEKPLLSEEKIGTRLRFDGQLLGNNLMKRVAFDSFHFVKVNKTMEEPNLLWERFHQRQNFGKAIANLNRERGANYMFRAYFTEGLIRSPYLLNRYFRNPVVLNNSE